MIVIIEDEIFASPSAGQLNLLGLFRLGFDGKHRIQADPIYGLSQDTALDRWLEQLPQLQREEVVLALEAGLEEDASGILPDFAIRVGTVKEADWEASPLRLPLAAALKWLSEPLYLLLENLSNDGEFLRVVAPSPWRDHYLKLLEDRFVDINHGGGVGDMKSRVEQIKRREALRMFALFDSDARLPGEPSAQSEGLKHACGNGGVAHHQLRRRNIESYLPVKALMAWANKSVKGSRERRKKVEAFARMNDLQRHHFNLKGGFEKDRHHEIPPFYGEHASNPWLRNGFGETIGSLFHEKDFPILEEWLIRDGQRQETTEILQSIFRRL